MPPPPPLTPGARLGRAAATLLTCSPAHAHSPGKAPQRRIGTALGRGGRHLLGAFGRVLRCLGLQISGVLYLIFALSFGATGVKGWLADHRASALVHHAASLTQAGPATEIELALALIFAYFGLSSLLRASNHS